MSIYSQNGEIHSEIFTHRFIHQYLNLWCKQVTEIIPCDALFLHKAVNKSIFYQISHNFKYPLRIA